MTTGVGVRLSDMPSATGFTDSDYVFMTQGGATVKGTVSQLKTAVAVNATLETFVSGVDFTPGVTTSLTLANTYASPNNIGVFFDGTPQFDFTLTGTTLSFPNGGIPSGTQKIFVKGVIPRPIGAPSVGTVDDNTVKNGSALYRRLNSFVDVTDPQWGGCDLTGVLDCTTAVRAAIAYALAHGISGVYFPAGTYRFSAASPSLDPGAGNLVFFGDGMDSTILIHEEGNANPSSSPFESRKHLFMHVSDTVMKGSIEFAHLCIKGTFAEGGYVERGGASIALNYYRSMYIHHCRFVNKSQMNMANEYIVSAQVQHNEFDSTCRDMARFRSSWNCFIAQNRFMHCDDDAVALHQAVYVSGTGNIREGIIVADNTFEDTCGIHILGGRVVNVHDNILRRVKQTVISIDSDASEGVNPMFAINVHDNQIFDSIIRPASFPQSQFACISVNYGGVYGRPTGSPAPMENQSGTQTFLAPYAYRDVQGGTSTYPGMFAINIHDNLIQRTLPAVANYSAWGFGKCFSVSGLVDPPVTDAELRPSAGIVVQSDARAIRIHGNTVSCANYGVILDSPTRSFSGLGSKIHDNLFYDCILGGIQINSPASQQNMQVWIDGNEFNLDPYCLSTNRGSAGSWQADSGPYGVACNGISGLLVTGNVFSNLCGPLSGSLSSLWNARGNWARCQPNVNGFSTSNKGIGNVPVVGDRFTIDTFYSDPTQSNYQTPMNTSSFSNESSGMPTTGFWMAGTFVRNVNAAVAAYGYYRLTTGSGNVSGTDWKTVALS